MNDPFLEYVVVSVEHNWFCVRNSSGWLLFTCKVSEMPKQGLALADIAEELKSNQTAWESCQPTQEKDER